MSQNQPKENERQDNQPEEAAPESAEAQEGAATGGEGEGGEDQVARLEAEVQALKDQLLRAMAETENTRRRLEQQAEERGRYAVSQFARDILGVADNLRRALQAVPETQGEGGDEVTRNLVVGVEMTERELMNTLERHGIRRIESLGQPFDPNLHQAMMEVEDASQPAGTVVQEMQTGYVIHDRLLRPAMVAVSKGGPKREPRPREDGDGGEPGEGIDTTA